MSRTRMMSAGWSLAVALVITVPVLAQQQVLKNTNAQQQEAPPQKKWQSGDVELQNSRVYCFVGKTGFGHEHAIEGMLNSGSIRLGASDKCGKLEFDLRSFQADTQQARNYIGLAGTTDAGTIRKVQANMLGPEVLDTARFPTATFDIKSARKHQSKQPPAKGQEYLIDGEFTLHGVKRALKFIAIGEMQDGWVHLRGNFGIRQTDFGIRPFTAALGTVGITNELSIYGDLWVVPEPEPAK